MFGETVLKSESWRAVSGNTKWLDKWNDNSTPFNAGIIPTINCQSKASPNFEYYLPSARKGQYGQKSIGFLKTLRYFWHPSYIG